MNSRNNLRHIVWDWNGTLLDDVDFCIRVVNEVGARRGIPSVARERYREVFTFPVIEYYQALGFDFDKEPFAIPAQEWVDGYTAGVLSEARLHEGAADVLAALAEAGFAQSILSAHHQELLEHAVQHFGITRYVDPILGLDDHYAESKLQLGKAWLDSAGIDRDSVIMVGDTLHDHEVADALGVACLLVAHGHQSEGQLARAGVPVVRDLGEVREYLLERD
jgi:phosphoglycolate phosphatase